MSAVTNHRQIPAGVTVISFDIWKTLLEGNRSFTPVRSQCIIDTFGLPVEVGEMLAAYREIDPAMDRRMETTGLDVGAAVRLKGMFDALGLDHLPQPDQSAVDRLQAELGELRRRPDNIPTLIEADLPETLAKLRAQGYRLALLSNTGFDDGNSMRPLLQQIGILEHIEVPLFSSDLGVCKPSPAVYQRLATECGAPSGQILHIGDNINADYRAHDAGCYALVYAPKGSRLPHVRNMRQLLA